ncbi:hypothetical protein Hanom_Chr12g01133271 [Helianthus anomalus]
MVVKDGDGGRWFRAGKIGGGLGKEDEDGGIRFGMSWGEKDEDGGFYLIVFLILNN